MSRRRLTVPPPPQPLQPLPLICSLQLLRLLPPALPLLLRLLLPLLLRFLRPLGLRRPSGQHAFCRPPRNRHLSETVVAEPTYSILFLFLLTAVDCGCHVLLAFRYFLLRYDIDDDGHGDSDGAEPRRSKPAKLHELGLPFCFLRDSAIGRLLARGRGCLAFLDDRWVLCCE